MLSPTQYPSRLPHAADLTRHYPFATRARTAGTPQERDSFAMFMLIGEHAFASRRRFRRAR